MAPLRPPGDLLICSKTGLMSDPWHILQETCVQVAVKTIEPGRKSIAQERLHAVRHAYRESSLLSRCSHPNVIFLYETIKEEHATYLILEYCPGGDLVEYLCQQANQVFSEDLSRLFFCQLTAGVKYLHKLGIVHRDLKAENLLLDATKTRLKICDLGLGERWKAGSSLKTVCGSPEYLAPELFAARNTVYGPEVDLWSMGIVLFVMLTGQLPFFSVNNDHVEIAQNAHTGLASQHKNIIRSLSTGARNVIQNLIKPFPRERWTLPILLNTSYVRNSGVPFYAQGLPPPSSVQCADVAERLKSTLGSEKSSLSSLVKRTAVSEKRNGNFATCMTMLHERMRLKGKPTTPLKLCPIRNCSPFDEDVLEVDSNELAHQKVGSSKNRAPGLRSPTAWTSTTVITRRAADMRTHSEANIFEPSADQENRTAFRFSSTRLPTNKQKDMELLKADERKPKKRRKITGPTNIATRIFGPPLQQLEKLAFHSESPPNPGYCEKSTDPTVPENSASSFNNFALYEKPDCFGNFGKEFSSNDRYFPVNHPGDKNHSPDYENKSIVNWIHNRRDCNLETGDAEIVSINAVTDSAAPALVNKFEPRTKTVVIHRGKKLQKKSSLLGSIKQSDMNLADRRKLLDGSRTAMTNTPVSSDVVIRLGKETSSGTVFDRLYNTQTLSTKAKRLTRSREKSVGNDPTKPYQFKSKFRADDAAKVLQPRNSVEKSTHIVDSTNILKKAIEYPVTSKKTAVAAAKNKLANAEDHELWISRGTLDAFVKPKGKLSPIKPASTTLNRSKPVLNPTVPVTLRNTYPQMETILQPDDWEYKSEPRTPETSGFSDRPPSRIGHYESLPVVLAPSPESARHPYRYDPCPLPGNGNSK